MTRVRDDAILGPIFVAKIKDREPHLQKMFAFWSSVALMSGRYHGQPICLAPSVADRCSTL
jgi:hemoglobin